MTRRPTRRPTPRPTPRPTRQREGALAAVALFTAIPVRITLPPPAFRAALRWAPAAGVLVAAVAVGVAAGARWLFPGGSGALLTATLTVAATALLTRGLHLDGLADTADGLGPLADRDRALTVMKQPDVGAFGVATLVVVLLLQVGALARAIDAHPGLPALASLAAAILVGRLAMLRAGLPGVPPARPDGLGAAVAGTVPGWLLAAATAVVAAATAAPALLGHPGLAVHLLLTVPAGLAAAEVLLRRATGVLGGVTGDVFGAVCELATTAALLAAAAR